MNVGGEKKKFTKFDSKVVKQWWMSVCANPLLKIVHSK